MNERAVLSLHRCTICDTRWLLWPSGTGGATDATWNLLDQYAKPGSCCDNVAMGDQIEHLRDLIVTLARKCIIGEYCSLHGFIHGAEAAELRNHVERLIAKFAQFHHSAFEFGRALNRMLDEVDARDSVAYGEPGVGVAGSRDLTGVEVLTVVAPLPEGAFKDRVLRMLKAERNTHGDYFTDRDLREHGQDWG